MSHILKVMQQLV